jgi:hypothetical protein
MEPKRGYRMSQLWQDRETNIASKTTNSSDVTADDIRRVARVAAAKATAREQVHQGVRHPGGRAGSATNSNTSAQGH